MDEFEGIYKKLNGAQRQAVDAIDGPVLVVAGPGTGKTQLLSARVAQILRKTDALPQNVLCLTFTESGAQNMRERLTRFIGREAYDVQISTYHAFGGDLIRRYPEYFADTRLERPVDELGKRQVLGSIVDNLSYRSPLKQARHHLGDLMTTISEVKRGLLSPDGLRGIAAANLAVIGQASPVISEALEPFVKRMPAKLEAALPAFATIHTILTEASEAAPLHPPFESLAQLAADQLKLAIDKAQDIGKAKPFTDWKNTWLAKNADNHYVLAGSLEAARMAELANVLEAYEKTLADRGLYDFDDMILRAIQALEHNPDLKYTLQERYQYILLDEFQDTNAAQLRLVELLTDNPANEGRPNVLAVGDDDQAIYAFQGAQYSNMLDFFHLFRDVLVINLTENYRSRPEILETAQGVSSQITDNLSASFSDLDKSLTAKNNSLPEVALAHTEYLSEVAERSGVAAAIRQLITDGTKPSDIAVLAPKHRYLEPLVAHLDGIPLRYERRENILDAPVVRQLLTMSKLVLALQARNFAVADSLWPEVLSYPFWNFAVSDIWKLSWHATDQRKHWSELLLSSDTFRPAVLLFYALAGQAQTETLEVVLDRLIGTDEVLTGEADMPSVRSPLRAAMENNEAMLYQTATELTVLRERLREHELQREGVLTLPDLLAFIREYEDAEQQMTNTSPYAEAADAVQLMTVFKAKGLEFAHVFLVCCQDDVWGSSSRGNSNKLTLPANLAPIRHAGSTEDERLRIFFVALTRAKYGLHLSSHASNFSGRKTTRLKYLDEAEQADDTIISTVLPEPYNTVVRDVADGVALSTLETNWRLRHSTLSPPLRELLSERLSTYRLSPTHLTAFIDLEHAGPQSFLMNTLLRFPTAPSVDIDFGNAMHETLQWVQLELNQDGLLPGLDQTRAYFGQRLELKPLGTEQLATQQARGEHALGIFLAQAGRRFKAGNRPEYNFRDEGVVYGNVQMSGKIDLLEINETDKTVTVVDYKTGSLGSDPAKRHRYELQLYCYKLLLQGSHSFRGYTVGQGKLVFVEPDASGQVQEHVVSFREDELERVKQLVIAMWQHVMDVDMPDVSAYGTSLTDIKHFEADLLQSE